MRTVASHTPARCSKRLNVAVVRDTIVSRAANTACLTVRFYLWPKTAMARCGLVPTAADCIA